MSEHQPPIIDAQVHAYEADHPGRPWAAVLTGPPSANGAEMVAAMDALAGFADAGDGLPAPTNAPLPLGKEKNSRLGDVEVKAEDSEPKGLDTPDERVHA